MPKLLARIWRSSTQRVMSLGAAGMVLALAADVLIARRFGFGLTTDALVIALTLPRLVGTVGRDATKFSLMTVFIQTQREDGDEAFKDLGARVLTLFLVIGLIITTAGIVLAGPIVSIIGWGLEPEGRALSATLLRIASGIAVFALGSSVLEVMLNSQKHFTITALRNSVAPLLVILAVLFSWRSTDHVMSVYVIGGAFTAGYALYFQLLIISAASRLHLGRLPLRLPNRETFVKLRGTISYPLTGFGVRQLARVAERAIASMGPSGSVAAFYYAYRLLAAIQNIVGVSVAITGQPKLTEHDLDGERARFRAALWRRVRVILLIAAPAAVMLMLLSTPIITLLYGRGGMNPDRLEASASVLFILGPAVVFYCLTPVLNSALYARKRYGAVLYNMCLAAGVNVLLAYVLFNGLGLDNVDWAVIEYVTDNLMPPSARAALIDGLGLDGVAWAATIAAIISVLNLFWLIRRTGRTQTPATTP